VLNALPETTKLWKGMSHKWKNAGNGGWTILNSMHYNETETNGGLPMELRKKWRSSVRNNTNRCKTLMVSRRERLKQRKRNANEALQFVFLLLFFDSTSNIRSF